MEITFCLHCFEFTMCFLCTEVTLCFLCTALNSCLSFIELTLCYYLLSWVCAYLELKLCLFCIEMTLCLLYIELTWCLLYWVDLVLTILSWLCAYIKLIWLCADFNQYGDDNLFFAQLLTVGIKIIMFSDPCLQVTMYSRFHPFVDFHQHVLFKFFRTKSHGIPTEIHTILIWVNQAQVSWNQRKVQGYSEW